MRRLLGTRNCRHLQGKCLHGNIDDELCKLLIQNRGQTLTCQSKHELDDGFDIWTLGLLSLRQPEVFVSTGSVGHYLRLQ